MKHPIIPERLVAAAFLAAGLAAACGSASPQAPDVIASPTTASATPDAVMSPTRTTAVTAGSCTTGDGVNDACTCDSDAHNFCAGFYATDWQSYANGLGYTTASWKYGLLDCLGRHTVSASCTASLDRRQALNAQMMNACASYCSATRPQPGAEPCVDHLKSIYASLNSSCRVALDAHEAAKALDARGAL